MTRRQLPSRELSGILQAVPTSPTALTSVNTWVNQIYFNNSTGGALTVSVLDKQGSPQPLISAYSLAANTGVLFNFSDSCQFMSGGVTWSASGSGVVGSVFGYVIN